MLCQELSHLLGSGAIGGSEGSYTFKTMAQSELAMCFSFLLSHLAKQNQTCGTSCFELLVPLSSLTPLPTFNLAKVAVEKARYRSFTL